MQSKATTPEQYLEELPEDRKEPMLKLRQVILDNLPSGFEECMNYKMLGYVVPHSVYPDGYHCNTKLPLPFMNLASQKNFIAVYHMGIYANPELMEWFTTEYANRVKGKLDMGKSCVRLKKMDQIPYDLFGELASKMTAQEWIDLYEANLKR
ncbi:DUF1801 domain-containing protein [Owenweeksia hongkongensis]|uniref:YdhG-like domain-containing protein n=1 Tax=Owenweeksia hongkongensis (strain DSM 17368 / CIP 108786 / JCM 12287 / NRRL B-23963 / UST20020801) TaxID=926562 RepID=G8R431_OWEHD|nr:DUF1801 domain-containing protein [Owenweeksia hongkongensis]AEV33098.1 protein of unknown function (DU1801) [Owenweeksia hongkongensis DSM 17368]